MAAQFKEPALNFVNDITELEGAVLGLNFKDEDPATVDIIVVRDDDPGFNILGGWAAAGGDFMQPYQPGWVNLVILPSLAADGDDAVMALTPFHETGHVLLDGGNPIHVLGDTVNMMYPLESWPETLSSPKRVKEEQNTDVRVRSGPTTTPPLLQKK